VPLWFGDFIAAASFLGERATMIAGLCRSVRGISLALGAIEAAAVPLSAVSAQGTPRKGDIPRMTAPYGTTLSTLDIHAARRADGSHS
jgi:hypothetical protein